MERRDFITLIGGAMMVPLVSRAQQKAMPVIGFLSAGSPLPVTPFRQGLSDAGYVEGQNLAIEYRWAEGHYDRLPALAAELVGRKVDVIVTNWASVAKAATSTIPIVFLSGGDAVAEGLVASLARPGGNLTGISLFELWPKRLQLLSELVPLARSIVLLANPNNPRSERWIGNMEQTARGLGVQVSVLKAATEGELDTAFATLPKQQVGGLVVGPDLLFFRQREQLVALAARYAVPAMYDNRLYIMAGGLISYSSPWNNIYQLGLYAGKILNGAEPAELPVQQPTRFELIINLKTAKALGLTVPQTLLARADEVIE